MHHTLLGKIAVAALIALPIAVVGASIAVASVEVRQKANLTIENSATADVQLELRIDADGNKELRARARVEGLPLPNSQGDRFALCLNGLFIEDERVEDDGRLDIGDQIDQGFDFTTLVGQTVTIVNIGTQQDTCDGDIVLSGVVMMSHLE